MAEPSVQVCKFRPSVECHAGRQTRADCYICASLKAEMQKISLYQRQESNAREELRKAEATIKNLREKLERLERVLVVE